MTSENANHPALGQGPTTFTQKQPQPTVDITVDRTLSHARRVYVVSTDTP